VSITVFVNERPVQVPAAASVASAVAAYDEALGRKIADGTARVTDARGIGIDPASPLTAGSILRVIAGGRHVDADA
jgi:hypothetical protein